jgi:hypothetical protein
MLYFAFGCSCEQQVKIMAKNGVYFVFFLMKWKFWLIMRGFALIYHVYFNYIDFNRNSIRNFCNFVLPV